MRKFVVPALLAAGLLAGPAFAAMATTTGTISSIDAANHKLKLTSGETFVLPASWKADSHKVGDKVIVSYELKNGVMDASSVTAAR